MSAVNADNDMIMATSGGRWRDTIALLIANVEDGSISVERIEREIRR